MLYPYYYLLYKSNDSDTYWILDESDSLSYVKKQVRNVKSKDEKYYIVYRRYGEDIIDALLKLEFKRWRQFKMTDESKLLFISQTC